MGENAPEHVHKGPFERWKRPLASLPELLEIGRNAFRRAIPLRMLLSPALDVCHIERGSVTFWVEGEAFIANGGNTLLTLPGERHGGADDLLAPCRHYWLMLDLPPKMPPRWLGLPQDEGAALHHALRNPPSHLLKTGPKTALLFRRLLAILNSDAPAEEALAVLAARTTLVELLLELVRAERAKPETRLALELIRDAERLMDENLAAPLSVRELAARLGWSVSQFQQVFRRVVGQTPAEFYLHRRVVAARERIRTSDLSLGRIAKECGFSSGQYMATCFRRLLKHPPSRLRCAKATLERHKAKKSSSSTTSKL